MSVRKSSLTFCRDYRIMTAILSNLI